MGSPDTNLLLRALFLCREFWGFICPDTCFKGFGYFCVGSLGVDLSRHIFRTFSVGQVVGDSWPPSLLESLEPKLYSGWKCPVVFEFTFFGRAVGLAEDV